MAEQPNQLLVRRGFEAFNSGDVDTLVEIIADDAVQIMPGANVVAGEHKGREAILTMYARLFEETAGTLKVVLEGTYAAGNSVVAIYRGTAQRNGRSLDQRNALVFEIEHGQAVRLTDLPADLAALDLFWC
jgi:ketosteroid isomerase-like protein